MAAKSYRGDYTVRIEFPLGGIGSGCVSLAGNGELINFETFSLPNKESRNGYTHFAIKAEADGELLDARILQGDIRENFYGHGLGGHHSWGYGHGPLRTTMAGFPHFADTEFRGCFPYAEIAFRNEAFPASVTLEAFNPFLPSNDKDSSLPAAFFRWKLHNTTDRTVRYTIAFSCGNPLEEETVNTAFCEQGICGIHMTGKGSESQDRINGSFRISTDAAESRVQEYWYRGAWFDDSTVYWQEFAAAGPMPERHYETPGRSDMGTLCASLTLAPRESGDLRFLLSWYVPYFVKTWGLREGQTPPVWKNYYAQLFSSHGELMHYLYRERDRLDTTSRLFARTLAETSLPEAVSDAVLSNLSILKSPTCLRLEDGSFYAFEGTNRQVGSCEGSCTHVWNYAYALPFLFPALERSMRELDYTYNQMDNGGMRFRLMLPPGGSPNGNRACADGELGGILKFYRDFRISGDEAWLRKWWPRVERSLAYAWSPENRDRWDPDRTGVLTGRQHHTLDVELFGASSWLNGFYLAALKAAAEISRHLGKTEEAEEYEAMFRRGSAYTESALFNGEYYLQKIDLTDRGALADERGGDEWARNFYWDTETGQVKYQYGEGCEIDQMLAQWHADLIGLGDIFDKEHRHRAAAALFRNNFRKMRNIPNPCRLYAVNDEKGMLICTWPEGARKPRIPIPYTEETMCGFEYAAAGLLLSEGYEEECLQVVEAIRDRYDGKKRNPYGEIECGASYARSLASYALLLLYSGFRYDMSRGEIGFAPLHREEGYSSFWSLDGAWGKISYTNGSYLFSVLYGEITLRRFFLPERIGRVMREGEILPFAAEGEVLLFRDPCRVEAGQTLLFFRDDAAASGVAGCGE